MVNKAARIAARTIDDQLPHHGLRICSLAPCKRVDVLLTGTEIDHVSLQKKKDHVQQASSLLIEEEITCNERLQKEGSNSAYVDAVQVLVFVDAHNLPFLHCMTGRCKVQLIKDTHDRITISSSFSSLQFSQNN